MASSVTEATTMPGNMVLLILLFILEGQYGKLQLEVCVALIYFQATQWRITDGTVLMGGCLLQKTEIMILEMGTIVQQSWPEVAFGMEMDWMGISMACTSLVEIGIIEWHGDHGDGQHW